VLQRVAVCCSVVQHGAVYRISVEAGWWYSSWVVRDRVQEGERAQERVRESKRARDSWRERER